MPARLVYKSQKFYCDDLSLEGAIDFGITLLTNGGLKMYMQINPEYIIANFKTPYTLSRLIKVLMHESAKLVSFKRFSNRSAQVK